MSEDEIAQEVADILCKKIDYQAIEHLVTLLAHGEILSKEEHEAWRIQIIKGLCETYQIASVYRSLQKQDSMDFFHNQGYAGM